jgi:eukaryotic-like serine/threonine-protein kinase
MAPLVIGGRYELVQRLGWGGMATVWAGEDLILGRPVAVKVLHEGLAQDVGFRGRFEREAHHAALLSHPNVVTVHDSGQEDETLFMVMELVDGRSLRSILSSAVGPVAVSHAVRLGRQVLAALAHAHARGIVHRDIKPANILIDNEDVVKVADFGIAKAAEDTTDLSPAGMVMGTAAYVSPEQAAGRAVTPASDLYSLGCVLYECLACQPPFVGPSVLAVALQHYNDSPPPLRSRAPAAHPAIERVVMRALEKDPARRFESAAEMDEAWVKAGGDASSMSLVGAPVDHDVNDDGWREFVPAGRMASTGNMGQIGID